MIVSDVDIVHQILANFMQRIEEEDSNGSSQCGYEYETTETHGPQDHFQASSRSGRIGLSQSLAYRKRGRVWERERESCEGEFVRDSQRLLQAKIRVIFSGRRPCSLVALKVSSSATSLGSLPSSGGSKRSQGSLPALGGSKRRLDSLPYQDSSQCLPRFSAFTGCGEKGSCGSLPGEGRLLRFSAGRRKIVAVLCRRKEEGSLPSPRSGEKGSVAVLCRRKEEGFSAITV
ncbi:hypothetical protein M5K25_010987 [Dendrobium thyrsiflorum]|uniref:Uncharacterized protein n=1 Tax=Dendrobium thyrsiflorum TaxID=117978 RepID=A0ABD0V8R2_DENTH